jgi:alpha-2-macroglobulin
VDSRTAQEMRGNVEAGLRRLKLFQLPNGGFSYWPGEGSLSEWGSVYAGHFLVEADRAGYALPTGLKAKWLGYMRTASRDWQNSVSDGWSYRS